MLKEVPCLASNRATKYSMTILSAQCTLKQWVSGLLPWMTPYNNISYHEEPQSTNMFTGQEKLISGSAILLLLNYCQNNLSVKKFIYIHTRVHLPCNKRSWSIFPAFRVIFGIFHGISNSKFLCIFSTICCGTLVLKHCFEVSVSRQR